MPFLGLLILWFLVLPFLALLVYLNVVTLSFTRLGLSAGEAGLLLLAIVVGSVVNIPISRRKIRVVDPRFGWLPVGFLFFFPPRVQEQVIAVNLGGAVIPTLFALYLLTRTPLLPALMGVAVVAGVARRLARPVPGVGIRLPALIPPLVAALVGVLLGGAHSPAVAYVSGVLGTLIGADLMNLHRLREVGGYALSIGGAGIYDGIFLVGIVAALLG